MLLRLSTDRMDTTQLQQQLQMNADSKSVTDLSFNVSGQKRLSNNLPGIMVKCFIGTLQCRIPRTLMSRVNQLSVKLLISSQAERSVLLHLKQLFSCLEREVFSVL